MERAPAPKDPLVGTGATKCTSVNVTPNPYMLDDGAFCYYTCEDASGKNCFRDASTFELEKNKCEAPLSSGTMDCKDLSSVSDTWCPRTTCVEDAVTRVGTCRYVCSDGRSCTDKAPGGCDLPSINRPDCMPEFPCSD